MRLCKYLFRDINFEPEAVQPCCNVNRISVPRLPFAGGRLEMRSYAAHIQDVVSRLQDSGEKLCQGCPELEQIADHENFRARINFQTVSINMHRHLCNCKCVYCDLWKGTGGGYPILPVLQGLAGQNVLHHNCFFSWGGGEPSILPDFEQTSIWLMDENKNWFQYVHTSCLRFSPAIARILADGRGAIDVSLDSASHEMYKKVKGLDGFDLVCKNLEQYCLVAKNINAVHLKYIIFELNNSIQEIEKFLLLCLRLGLKQVQYSFNFHELNKSGPSAKTLLGAAFFKQCCARHGLVCNPFFIPPKWQTMVDDLAARHFA